MNKKYVEISVDNKTVVIVAEIKECDPIEFIQRKKAAQNNFKKMMDGYEKRISNLEREVRHLKGED